MRWPQAFTLIYQEMQLAPNLTVAENIFLGSELSRGGLVQRKEMAARPGGH